MKTAKRLTQLKLVASAGIDKGKDVQAHRRQKLIGKLRQQFDAAKAEQDGVAYTIARTRRLKDKETGAVQLVTVQRPVPKFYFADARGKWYFQLRYGSKRLAVQDGKDAVEVGAKTNLLPVIETLIEAVEQGELDEQLLGISGQHRKGHGASRKSAQPAST